MQTCQFCSHKNEVFFEVNEVLLNSQEVSSISFFKKGLRILFVEERPEGESPFSAGLKFVLKKKFFSLLRGRSVLKPCVGFTYVFKCKDPKNREYCLRSFFEELKAFWPDVVVWVHEGEGFRLVEDFKNFSFNFLSVEINLKDTSSVKKKFRFLVDFVIKNQMLGFLVKTEEDFSKFLTAFKEASDRVLYVYCGTGLAFEKKKIDFLRFFESVDRGGYIPSGFSIFQIGWRTDGGVVFYQIPLWFHFIVDEWIRVFSGFLKNIRDRGKRIVLVRKMADGVVDFSCRSLLREFGFSYSFVRDFEKKESPVSFELAFSKVEVIVSRYLEILENVKKTGFYELSQKIDFRDFGFGENVKVVTNDGISFLGVIKKRQKDEDFVKRFKVFSLNSFSVKDYFDVNDAEVGGLCQSFYEGEIDRCLNLFTGLTEDVEKCYSVKAEAFKNVVLGYWRQLVLFKRLRGSCGKVFVPYYKDKDCKKDCRDKSVNRSFVEIDVYRACKVRAVYLNRVVLPLVAELRVNGLLVNVSVLENILNVLEQSVKKLLKSGNGALGNSERESAVADVLKGKVSACRAFFKRYEEVVKVLRNFDLAVEDLREDSLKNKELYVDVFRLFSLRRFLSLKRLLEEVYFSVFEDNKVFPFYDVDSSKTGRLICKNPAVFRVPVKKIVLCKNCGALVPFWFCEKRKCFLCQKSGKDFVEVDFSNIFVASSFDLKQAEVVTLCNFSRDEVLGRYLKSGDVYCYLASCVLGENYEKIFSLYQKGDFLGEKFRNLGKKKAFQLIYGGEYEDLPDKFFSSLKGWFEDVKKECLKGDSNRVGTLFGKVRVCSNEEKSDVKRKFRVFVNTPVQGSTSELFVLFVYYLTQKLKALGLKFKPCFLNQDSCYFVPILSEKGVVKFEGVLKDSFEEFKNIKGVLRFLGLNIEVFIPQLNCSFEAKVRR